MNDNTREATLEEKEIVLDGEVCHICKRPKDLLKVARLYPDIDRFSLKFIGAACYDCINEKKPENFFIPLVFHNAKGMICIIL